MGIYIGRGVVTIPSGRSKIKYVANHSVCLEYLLNLVKEQRAKILASPDTCPLDKLYQLMQLTLNQQCLDIGQTMIIEKSEGT